MEQEELDEQLINIGPQPVLDEFDDVPKLPEVRKYLSHV